MRQAIIDFNWNKAFLNTHTSKKVSIFSNTITNILSNFIPQETIVCDNKDPAWLNKAIKSVIHKKYETIKKPRKRYNNIQLLQRQRIFQEKLNFFINVSRQNHYSRMPTKRTKFHKSSMAYWQQPFSNNKKYLQSHHSTIKAIL